ncbi:hypothetical protein [Flavobacterium tyrosinilyticum]|uniref:hypothetical protein n=1 Tax=Flavobacterium tyrosinilyticum TaxID=1658740 RepID=UPI00202FADDD|nr:hypothetical protein [Flavobacterium tyrosinilyticum]MCM0666898.1 hypothetical protein [Flavobacterium tyrosinilyticum]
MSQNVYPPTGNVGIGTTNPQQKFVVSNDNKEGFEVYLDPGSTLVGLQSYNRSLGTHAKMQLDASQFSFMYGSVGIGTLNPQQKFVVSNDNKEGFEVYLDPGSTLVGLQSYNRSLGTHSKMQLDASQFSFMYGSVGIGTLNPQQKFVVSNDNKEGFEVYLDPVSALVGLQSYNRSLGTHSKMQLDASQFSFMYGKVGIGKLNPTNELDVNGTIHSKEVKVDMTGWSDFVFKKDYALPSLEEVEKHILEKGHLQNIPNEEEVLKNGINLGEMNSKLLQKIEEMTLYMIEMKKENENMKKENESLQRNQRNLEERIKKIETR